MVDWRKHFRYDSVTGQLFWLTCPIGYCKNDRYARMWNTRFAGKLAGWKQYANGSVCGICVRMLGVKGLLLAHRIIWEMHHGVIPDDRIIDHRDGNPLNNRLDNLRLATYSQNLMNAKMRRTNLYGMKGIRKIQSGMYQARIQVQGKVTALGAYKTKEEAHAAYCEAARKYHGEFARTT